MSNVYCYVDTCKYRSKRRSTKQNKGGQWLYRCTKDTLVLTPAPFCDSVEELGENIVDCIAYEDKQSGATRFKRK